MAIWHVTFSVRHEFKRRPEKSNSRQSPSGYLARGYETNRSALICFSFFARLGESLQGIPSARFSFAYYSRQDNKKGNSMQSRVIFINRAGFSLAVLQERRAFYFISFRLFFLRNGSLYMYVCIPHAFPFPANIGGKNFDEKIVRKTKKRDFM